MDLLPAATAPEAIRGLATIIREGVKYGRNEEARSAAAHWEGELRRAYEESRPVEIPTLGRRAGMPRMDNDRTFDATGCDIYLFDPAWEKYDRIVARARYPGQVFFPKPSGIELPPTWSARVYEQIGWPPENREPGRHPFRIFVDFTRGAYTFAIPIHDARDPWQGVEFIARGVFVPPFHPSIPFRSYLVVGDNTSAVTVSLHRWLTVYLAQRMLLTDEEERRAVEAFFLAGANGSVTARLAAYERTKRRFVQPVGGRPSFGAYFNKSLRMIELDEQYAEQSMAVSLDTADQNGRRRALDVEDPCAWERFDGSQDTGGVQVSYPTHVSLQELRRSEPALHRALLDRIQRGAVEVFLHEGKPCVWVSDANSVDEERLRNALKRVPKRFPDKRKGWIDRLVCRGETLASARRKLKRWMNEDLFSEEEIEASIAAGRQVRFPRSDGPTEGS